MAIQVKVPSPGESISQVQIAAWLVKSGDFVDKDAEIVEIDSDKATLTVNAEASGIITLMAEAGDTVEVGSVIAEIETSAAAPSSPAPKVAAATVAESPLPAKAEPVPPLQPASELQVTVSPVAREILRRKGISQRDLIASIHQIRIGKADVEGLELASLIQPEQPTSVASMPGGSREEHKEKMTTLRQKLAKRLVGVRNETAMLTTFNEVNMTPLKKLRDNYNKRFQEKYGIKLGYMSLFTKAVTLALQEFPRVNSRIDGDDIITPRFADIGIAVSAPKGLVVPVIRNAEVMSLAAIELKIKELADKARSNKISLEEMSGGTFTITNGGVFGSMLSTPILNPPQSAILGMHNIVDRPLAVEGRVEIHPVMYIALSYDHRVIDGRESVGFLLRVKEILESPERMLSAGKDPMELLLGL
jgi:2-oxoglutarate dehydrogenase E2 component (dihydrolipoamide succinyltransferase)